MNDYAGIPEGSVVITPTTMYAEMRATHEEVQRLANIIDPALNELREDIRDQENRLRMLEKRVWVAAGVAMVAATAVSNLDLTALGV